MREKELETKEEYLRKKLAKVQSELKSTNDHLQQKEKEHSEKNKKNVELLKKYFQDKDRMKESFPKCETKVKELERKLAHAPVASSRQGKRLECTNLSSLEKKDLYPKPPKQPRTLE